MFGSNSPRRPERASDQRVRLAHPDSQIQLSNNVINFRVAFATAFNYTATRTIRQAPTTPFCIVALLGLANHSTPQHPGAGHSLEHAAEASVNHRRNRRFLGGFEE
jgi:hypothetical protein